MTQEANTTLQGEELVRAWKNWVRWHRGITSEAVEERFYTYVHTLEQSFVDDALIGLEQDEGPYKVSEETASRIRQIAEPHSDTIISAYFAKRGFK